MVATLSPMQDELIECFLAERRRKLESDPSSTHGEVVASGTGGSYPSEDVLKFFYYLLPNQDLIEKSLEILDGTTDHYKTVVEFEDSLTKRKYWKVVRARDREYLCLHNFCSCPAFSQIAKTTTEGKVLCKHLLAVKLGMALNMVEMRQLNTQQFIDVMVSAASTHLPA
jgi:predicted nucleic acid-binding Zn finger protein